MIEDLSGGWRQTHLGRLLGLAMRRFDERVLVLMASNVNVPLGLSHLAARGQVGAAHIHITRHLAVEGSRLTDLARAAGMSSSGATTASRKPAAIACCGSNISALITERFR